MRRTTLFMLVGLFGCGADAADGPDGGVFGGGDPPASDTVDDPTDDEGTGDAGDDMPSAGSDAGGGDGDAGPTDPPPAGDDGTTTGADDAGPTFGAGSNFDDVADMFDYVNATRDSYLPHERWSGLPWFGAGYHTNTTWPTQFAWDDALAAEAQAQADALAGGVPPSGDAATDGLTPPIYIVGVDTDHYVVSGRELADSWGVENLSSLSHHHGSARMAIYYQDPGGAGPVLTRMGIGAADAGGGDTWWVLVFE